MGGRTGKDSDRGDGSGKRSVRPELVRQQGDGREYSRRICQLKIINKSEKCDNNIYNPFLNKEGMGTRHLITSDDFIMAGLELAQHCQYQEAIAVCRKGLLLDPANNVAWLIIGDSFSQLNRYKDAVNAYDNVLQCTPKNANVWVNVANALRNLGQLDDALDACNHALSINPGLSRAWLNKGMILRDLNQYEGAIGCYDRALEIDPAIKGYKIAPPVTAGSHKRVSLKNL